LSGGDVAALAEQVRRHFGATLGLAVGPVCPGGDGVDEIELALAADSGAERLGHRLGGGPTLAPSRAAKTAIDLVRRSLGAAAEATPR
jgi:hypothetical protein